MLERFTRNIKRQILRIHKPADKTEIIRKKVGTFVHNQHAVGIQLKAFFVITGIKIERRPGRDIHQGMECRCAFHIHVNGFGRIFVIGKLIFVKLIVLLLRDLVLVFTPERNHAVEGFIFRIGFVLIFGAFL